MINVLGRSNSANVQKVMWCAAEPGLEVDRSDIGGAFGGNDTVEFDALNPNRTIPVLIDGDFSLWESNSIVGIVRLFYVRLKLSPRVALGEG